MISPVPICRVSELGEAGAFFTQDVERTPVLVTRDAKGAIRAMLNLCRHQGARLTHDRHGVTKTFTCILHGWTYDAEGNMGGGVLGRMAQSNPMLAQLRTMNALVPLSSELRHGFVWVMPQVNAPLDVPAFLGPNDAELATLENHVVRARSENPFPPSMRLRDVVSGALSLGGAGREVLVSDTTAFVFRADHVEWLTLCRRRAETDFGHSVGMDEDVLTLSQTILAP